MPTRRVTSAEGCGVTRGCYRVPKGCEPDECDYFLSWLPRNDSVAFEYVVRVDEKTPWAGFGVNSKRKMVGTTSEFMFFT